MLSRKKLLNVVREVDTKHVRGRRGSTYSYLKGKQSARICVIRSVGGIGDILMITPSLMELKRRFPKIHLSFGIDRHTTNGDIYYELLKNASFIDSLIDARYVQHNSFDHTIDMSAVCIGYERRDLPPRNRIDIFADHLGLTSMENKLPFYEVTPDELSVAKQFVSDFRQNSRYVVAVSIGSMEGKRCWAQPDDEKWPELIELLSKMYPGIKFIVNDFIGKCRSLMQYKNVHYLQNTSVRELGAIFTQCDHFVGPDSGPMHLAGALGIPSTILFGSIPPEARINHYPTHNSINLNSLPCIGCWYEQCPYNVKCMRDLQVGNVAMHVMSKMREFAVG